MRSISENVVIESIRGLVIDVNVNLPSDVLNALEGALKREVSSKGKQVIREILENAQIARSEKIPLCQDTGMAIFFVERGEEVMVSGGGLDSAIQQGMIKGYRDGFFRASMANPLTRVNSGDNSPATIHTRVIKGDGLKIDFLVKGGGAENMSRLYMLLPAGGRKEIIKRVVETVESGGAMACPPLIVGVGIGGSFDTAPALAKRALLKKVGEPNPDDVIAELERDILNEINELGIGPMGYGGKITALAVHIEEQPCHIASMPMAINLQCHSARHGFLVIQG